MTLVASETPYQGLRPFEAESSRFFFGRERHVSELLKRLRRQRFIAVVGTSGSGKSSLVRAGLIPALRKGFLFEAGWNWRIIVVRPGTAPFRNLADEFRRQYKAEALPTAFFEQVLRSSSQGIVECARGLLRAHDERENLLLVIDQFEEIFPSSEGASRSARDETAGFVLLLLEAARQQELGIYVLLTMRSDFLGRCQEFNGLPEALNDSQFLVPQLSRDELELAICAPARICGTEIEPALLSTLLAAVNGAQNQLPLLQHALARTWENWSERKTNLGDPVRLPDYEKVGAPIAAHELRASLDEHGNLLYAHLDRRKQEITKVLFQAIAFQPSGSQPIRRPLRLGRLLEVCRRKREFNLEDLSAQELENVIDYFRGDGVYFLRPYPSEEHTLREDSRIDLSHESLTREWKLYQAWILEESAARQSFVEVSTAAARFNTKPPTGRLWQDPELRAAEKLRQTHGWNDAWAQLYDDVPTIALAERFLKDSARRRVRAALVRTAIIGAIIVGLAAVGYAIQSTSQERQEKLLRARAEDSQKQAENFAKQAEESRRQALANLKRATTATQDLEEQVEIARAAWDSATKSQARAERSKLLADQQKQAAQDAMRVALQKDQALVVSNRQREDALQAAALANTELTSLASGETFANPILSNGADPAIAYYHGIYYYMDTTGVNLTIRATPDITDLRDAQAKIVWTPPPSSPYSHDIWGPELDRFDDHWYIYFAADAGSDSSHRMWVLENSSEDPMSGEWILKGKVSDPTDEWAVDPSAFEINGKRYLIWSGWKGTSGDEQDIYIAHLGKPWELDSGRTMLSRPEHGWERAGDLPSSSAKAHIDVNEAPKVLTHGEDIFLVYTASGCWTDHSALGVLRAKMGDDLLDPSSWHKFDRPFFQTNSNNGVFGPGHGTFFKSPDGHQDWIMYHAKSQPNRGCGAERSPRIQSFTWAPDGAPDFGTPVPVSKPITKPSSPAQPQVSPGRSR